MQFFLSFVWIRVILVPPEKFYILNETKALSVREKSNRQASIQISNVTKSIQLTFDFHMISWGSLLCSLASNTGAIVTGCFILKCIFKLNLTNRNMQARIGLKVVLKFWDWGICGTTTSFLRNINWLKSQFRKTHFHLRHPVFRGARLSSALLC